ncbi:siderophore ferric iron reductase [Photobacterium sp. MCCC 1A19761]|uniref:siderophore ferric iron reductase n=1 Tax=Photobacterium sp. MCCC 1A19761 TaxID=3115000 RepID=UPI00307CD885
MNQMQAYQRLFQLTEQFIPIMKGELDLTCAPDIQSETKLDPQQQDFQQQDPQKNQPKIIAGQAETDAHFQALYQFWEATHPEAGHPYWLTRSWLMSIWQPVYLAVFSVYLLKAVPNLKNMSQHYAEGVVAGYHLAPEELTEGDDSQLIQNACAHLIALVNHFQHHFNAFTRLRPGMTRPLLADSVLEALAALANHFPDAAPGDLKTHARMWLAELALASRHLDSLSQVAPKQNDSSPCWQVARISCCMHYRRHDGKLCANCPRAQAKNQRAESRTGTCERRQS